MAAAAAAAAAPGAAAASSLSLSQKPAVLIIGGLGFIGRYLALYIEQNQLASEVRLVDKVLPELAWLAPEFSKACSKDKFMQADASREQTMDRIFTPATGKSYTYVFNCGGETRYSQEDSVYQLRIVTLSDTLARECARRRIPAYVDFSTGIVYKPPSSSTVSSGGCAETAGLKPWLKLAKYKLAAEEGLEKIRAEFASRSGGGGGGGGETGELRYAVLRLPHVYGDYDQGFLARGLCLARVYQAKKDEMKWLYGKDLRINTVHVLDVATAAWLAAEWVSRVVTDDPELAAGRGGRVFNVVDGGDTKQGDMAAIIAALFGISTGFQSAWINTFARFNLDGAVDDVNDDVLQPWADLLHEAGIARPGPISPFMEKELLKDCDLCLDAGRAKRVLGWKPEPGQEKMSVDAVRKVVESYKRIGWWP